MIDNYSEHKPHTSIYQNRQVVTDGSTFEGMAAIVGAAIYRNSISNLNLLVKFDNPSDSDTSDENPLPINTAISLTNCCVATKDSTSLINQYMNVVPVIAPGAAAATIGVGVYVLMADGTFSSITTGWTTTSTTITFASTPFTGTTANGIAAYIVLDYGLYSKTTTPLLPIASTSDITSYFGPIDITNPLGFAASLALTSGSATTFYAEAAQLSTYTPGSDGRLSTSGAFALNSAGGYDSLTKVDNSTNVQFLSLLSKDGTFNKVADSMVTASSTHDRQQWRHLYLGSIYGDSSATAATIVPNVITECLSYNNNRTTVIWSDNPQYATVSDLGVITTSTLPMSYIAAAIAVYRSSLLPQQGMSNRNLSWIYSAPGTYTRFSQPQLNSMASYGAFIICQDTDFGPVYIRHQLTTDTNDGMFYYEDSVGVNLDNICYGTKSLIKGFTGIRNVTSTMMSELKTKIRNYLDSLLVTGGSMEEKQIGPQLLSYDGDTFDVYRDSNLLDRVHIIADLELPTPLNSIIVHYNGYVTVQS